jgi:hypothetical protein
MHDHTEHPQPSDAIEAMPAAPEADPGTRDADSPTWAAPTEGHPEPPVSTPLADADVDQLTTAAADAATAAATAPTAPVIGDRVEVTGGGAQRIEGHEVVVNQGGAAVIRGDQVRVDQGGALAIIARRVDVREGGAFLLVARRVTGDVKVAFDWRALATLFVGIIAVLVVRGRR